jgi:hydroxymethylpyrimidine pyrophosphatase-like HAD family hydrolase
MFGISPLTPAYGRDYKSAKALKEDFEADKDFVTADGRYINKSQIKELGLKTINARYKQLREVCVLKVR